MHPNSAKTILVVDDDRTIQLSFIDALEDEGYSVRAVNNGEEALSYLLAQGSKVDLILLDVMMPVMDGFTFRQEQLKHSQLANIPTILLSADSGNRTRAEALGLPFFRKPFRLDDLYATIEMLFSSQPATRF